MGDAVKARQHVAVESYLPSLPGWKRLEAAGGMGSLFVRSLRTIVRPPYSWTADALVETSIAIRRSIAPLIVSGGFFALGIAVVYFGGIVQRLATLDRGGGALLLGYTREAALWISMMVIAGAVGSSITADLGARRIREELDALAVLGVDQVRALVIPRIVALMIVMPVLGLIGLMTCLLVSYVALCTVFAGQVTPADFQASFWAFAYSADFLHYVFVLLVSGCFVGVVSCYKGLNAAGGTEGVGRAVNECVVISFFGVWLIHTLVTFVFFSLFPEVLVLRG
jgi:phospholipid/cholesterol/gamma-HCH transport system permease protein